MKTHPKYKVAEKVKNAVQLWMRIEMTCISTSTINLAQQRLLKVDPNLKSVYRESMNLSKHYDVFMARAKVEWETGVDFGSKTVVSDHSRLTSYKG